MSKQLLRCGTSIGANVSEALAAESTMDFVQKMAISQKEIKEVQYWLTLLNKTEYLTGIQYTSMLEGSQELYKMITSIILSSKQRNNKEK